MDLPVLAKVMGITLGLAGFLCLAQIWQIQYAYFPLEEREVEADTVFLAKSLAAGAKPILRHGTNHELQELLDEGARVSPAPNTAINRVVVRNRAGQVKAQNSNPAAADPKARVLERNVPVDEAEGDTLSVELNDRHVDYEVAWHKNRIVRSTAIATLLGLLATWALMRLVTRPIRELARSVQAVKAGNYQGLVTVRSRDEVGQLAAGFNQMLASLKEKEALNQQLLKRILATEEEQRLRVSRELNDQTSQALSSLVVGLAAVEDGADRGRLPELRALASQTLGEVHDMSLTLRPSVLEDLGLAPALETLCQGLAKRFAVQVDCVTIGIEGVNRLPLDMEIVLFRIIETATSAVLHHANAHSVQVLVQHKTTSVVAVIEHDGVGLGEGDWHAQCLRGNQVDLLAVEERARQMDGTLRIEATPGAGSSLFVELPLPRS